ncbi:MAG TPA: DUF2141 domain-containing protein [Candidatus Binataceae bacterium]|nr:DUF2141 domain-containing protein [Candidatus Binataceae bacterium]
MVNLKSSIIARWMVVIVASAGGLIAAATLAADAGSNTAPGIRVVVSGLRNDHGRVGCGLFKGPDGFPRDASREFRGMYVPISGGVAVFNFANVPAGTYAATVLHDENENGKMDFNWIGMPTKGYGFSNNAKATFSPPSFAAASFKYPGTGIVTAPITIVYR